MNTPTSSTRPFGPPIVIAHRGASGYLPEHTLAGKAYAHALGVDYLEQDVVLTRDDVPIVFHDLILEEVTDVAQRFPGRKRADGHWYVIDFDFAELLELTVRERIDLSTGAPTYPERFHGALPFRINTLAEELTLVQGLNAATGRTTGVYTEVKSPAWHHAAGKDLARAVLGTLAEFGYRSRDDGAYLQCFDAVELRRIRVELGSDLKLIQLVGENDWLESTTDYDALRTPRGLRALAGVADGIGPWIQQIVQWPSAGAAPVYSSLVEDAHAAGLAVHPYTFRVDQLPDHAPGAAAVHEALFDNAGIDGIFTDFSDVSLALLGRRPLKP